MFVRAEIPDCIEAGRDYYSVFIQHETDDVIPLISSAGRGGVGVCI